MGFKLMIWIMIRIFWKIILVVLNLQGGIVSLFSGTIVGWILNGFFWHSRDFSGGRFYRHSLAV